MKKRHTDLTHNEEAKTDSLLASYMIYLPDDGFDLDAFVHGGGRIVGRAPAVSLQEQLTGLLAKIALLQREHPKLAAQLEFLADFVADGASETAMEVRHEAIFALLYCLNEADLIPDYFPEIGYSDDAAVTELVLFRNAKSLERHCRARGLDWAALR